MQNHSTFPLIKKVAVKRNLIKISGITSKIDPN